MASVHKNYNAIIKTNHYLYSHDFIHRSMGRLYLCKVIVRANADQFTVAIGLWNMLQKEYINQWYTSFAAGAVIISLPIAILFVYMQKFYVEGMSGAVKG